MTDDQSSTDAGGDDSTDEGANNADGSMNDGSPVQLGSTDDVVEQNPDSLASLKERLDADQISSDPKL